MIHIKNIRTFKAKDYPNAHVERVDRTTVLGNPYPITETANREQVIESYRNYLNKERLQDSHIWQEVKRLAAIAKEQDVVLLCWCAPKACHGNVIKNAMEFINLEV